MGYCTALDFEKTLAQTQTTASPNPANLTRPAKLADLGKKLNLTATPGSSVATYSLTDIYFYIRQAESLVDAALKLQYVTPLRAIAAMTMRLLTDLDEYNNTINVSRAANLLPGHQLFLTDGTNSEIVEVDSIDGNQVTTLTDLVYEYGIHNTRVLLIQFPDPIPTITAKLACAAFYDKYAKAQSEPAKSEYGDQLRKDATAELNNIREGRTVLDSIRQGTRFVNPNLFDRYALKGVMDSDGTRSDQGRG